jgi:hypothetical protein
VSDSRVPSETEPFHVYECDGESDWFRVIWKDPTGYSRRSKPCSTIQEAIARTARHDWPWAIIHEREARSIEVVCRQGEWCDE